MIRWCFLRTSGRCRQLHGNGIIGIRREDKNEWERRVPFSPQQVASLIDDYGMKVIVQPSNNRCFTNEEYALSGAQVSEDLDECGTIFAVKEVPIPLLKPDRTYAFFSHTIKGQADNMPLLQSILDRNIRLIDYERIIDHDGQRLVKFGPFAGFAGVVDTLHAVGRACLERGFATPFLYISRAAEYRSLQDARNAVRACGDEIRAHGLPRELLPFTIVVTGTGSVSMAAQQMLHPLPCLYVNPEGIESLSLEAKTGNLRRVDSHSVYLTVASAQHMVDAKAGTSFNKREYYAHPDKYRPVFHKNILPHTRVLVNGMFWDPRFPRLVTTRQAMDAYAQEELPLLVLGDITCDPNGSVEFFHKSTPISDPYYTWDPVSGRPHEPHAMPRDVRKRAVWVMGVDHLPAEFPSDASEFFGKSLLPFGAALARHGQLGVGDPREHTEPLPSREHRKTFTGMPPELAPAIVAENGELLPAFKHLNQHLKRRAGTRPTDGQGGQPIGVSDSERSVLILGAGMSAGPALRALLEDDRNSIVMVDADAKNLEQTVTRWGKSSDQGRGVPAAAAGAQKRVRTVVGSATDAALLSNLMKPADIVVSLVPWNMHPVVLEAAVKEKVNVQTASYQTPAMDRFDAPARAAGMTILNECGLDPGLDIMSTVEFLEGIRADGGVVESYSSMCGALTAPECSTNSLRYKFSWSPAGVVGACQRPAEILSGGQQISIPPEMTYNLFKPFDMFPALAMEAVPNGNSMPYVDIFGLHDAHTVVRGTLRFPGFSDVFRAFIDLGAADETPLPPKKGKSLTWGDIFGADTVAALRARIATGHEARRDAAQAFKAANPSLKAYLGQIDSPWNMQSPKDIATAIVTELDMAPSTPIKAPILKAAGGAEATRKSLLAAHLSQLEALQLTGHDSDFVVLAHEVVARYGENERKLHRSVLLAHGASAPLRSVVPYLVGAPCGYAAQLQLDGKVKEVGLVRPTHRDIYLPVLSRIAEAGYKFVETSKDISKAI